MITVFIVATVCLLYVTYTYYKYKGMPPGPFGMPIIGYGPFLSGKPYEKMKNISLKYGSIFSINFGTKPLVVANDYETIHEILVTQGNSFSGRALVLTWETLLQKKDITTNQGPIWREHKRFVIKIMREIGFEMNSMEGIVMQEVDELTKKLSGASGKPVQISSLLFAPTLNVIWGVTAGKRFDFSDQDSIRFKEALNNINKLIASTQILNLLPFLRHVAPDISGYTKLCSERDEIFEYIKKEVALHWKDNADDNGKNDIISRYIAEIRKRPIRDDCPPYNSESLLFTAYDLFHAGSETLSSSLCWGFLYMALFPRVQRKVQEELDTLISKDSHLPYSSRECVPYTMATLHEIQRCASVAPLGAPHAAVKDTYIKGYCIRKGTMIVTNLWGLHHDKKAWGDPDNFRPERFLNSDGKLQKHDWLLPFGAGPRLCLGITLAEVELFGFFTALMHRFSFEPIPGEEPPSLEPVLKVTLQPQEYSLIVKDRVYNQ